MILLTVIPLSGAHCGESDYDADLADKALFDGRPKIWVELKSRKAPSQSGTPASDRPTEKRNAFFYHLIQLWNGQAKVNIGITQIFTKVKEYNLSFH